MRYQYWVIRYVPDPIRGERVNLGVIAGAGPDWALRRVANLQRASRLGGSATITSQFLLRIEAVIEQQLTSVETLMHQDGPERLSKGFVEDLRARMNNIVQLSSPRSVLADSADDAADLAFDLMVVDAGHEVRHRSRTLVVRRLQEAFEMAPDVLSHVSRYQQASVGQESASIDIAVTNTVARQLSQGWSFDVRNLQRVETQIHAWNYMMGRLRDEGGVLRAKSGRRRPNVLTIPRDVNINVLFRPPTSEEGNRQLNMAKEGWGRLGIDVVDEANAESVVDEAKKLIQA